MTATAFVFPLRRQRPGAVAAHDRHVPAPLLPGRAGTGRAAVRRPGGAAGRSAMNGQEGRPRVRAWRLRRPVRRTRRGEPASTTCSGLGHGPIPIASATRCQAPSSPDGGIGCRNGQVAMMDSLPVRLIAAASDDPSDGLSHPLAQPRARHPECSGIRGVSRLARSEIKDFWQAARKGTRAVASHDEDTTHARVERPGWHCAPPWSNPGKSLVPTWSPPSDKTKQQQWRPHWRLPGRSVPMTSGCSALGCGLLIGALSRWRDDLVVAGTCATVPHQGGRVRRGRCGAAVLVGEGTCGAGRNSWPRLATTNSTDRWGRGRPHLKALGGAVRGESLCGPGPRFLAEP